MTASTHSPGPPGRPRPTATASPSISPSRRRAGRCRDHLTGFGRAQLLRRLGDIIARDADALAEIETRDTGKLLREMRGQLAGIRPGSTTTQGWRTSCRAPRS
ncbi:MAG: aldehyde dehydrogenase family protein [Streptosporangiaceae bacterium]|jgi:hypothetical protein